jgi:hypothetical protein
MKFFRNYILVILGIVIVITLLQRFSVFPSWDGLFAGKPVVIEETPILISEIKELAEMITVTSFDEVVVDSIKASPFDVVHNITGISLPTISPSADRLVIIARGKVMAGIDLSNLMPDDIYVEKDSIRMTLPPARVFDVITNPSDFSTFSETGDWPSAAAMALKTQARDKILRRALNQGILNRANARAAAVMESFLRSLGYTRISLRS